jgi:hypothetical protein
MTLLDAMKAALADAKTSAKQRVALQAAIAAFGPADDAPPKKDDDEHEAVSAERKAWREDLNIKMGIAIPQLEAHWAGGNFAMPLLTPIQAREAIAAKAAGHR